MTTRTRPSPPPRPVEGFGVRWDPELHRWYVLEPSGRAATDGLGRRLVWETFSAAWGNRRIGRG
ncbi:hypothetical protein OG871_10475 [Kitasatospora sp. NBC_00374]|uniref:hypothetical protein n=1 Tax=Kitasatospora sp. NBC_00374 TaxID=2975964 RepID=UPI003253F5C1